MSAYRYTHFTRELMKEDSGLRPSPGLGDLLPHFDFIATDGRRVRSQDFAGQKLFLTFASLT